MRMRVYFTGAFNEIIKTELKDVDRVDAMNSMVKFYEQDTGKVLLAVSKIRLVEYFAIADDEGERDNEIINQENGGGT